ncbi:MULTISPECIES: ROK family protein [Niastella]|uniref:ROK family protein n=1 Tax=Niastella soli TaxID=2821487 RepID=A0ABS3Z448_9BACT|nr:ROK family protein [Niastella soli]MBO9204909.1 ROK family protein [Niastella soli]
MTNSSIVIGADIGGSHITAAQVDLTNKQLITSSLARSSVNSLDSASEIIRTWALCIKQAMQHRQFGKVCLAMPGPFDYTTGICLINEQNKYPLLYGLNVKELLASALGISINDIYLNNDAACFLQGEVFSGSISGYQPAVSVTLGTGLGTAIYENGAARSADWWNIPFRDGIAEDYLSTRWFVKQYTAITGNQADGVRQLAAQAMSNSLIKGLFAEFGKNLASFLNRFIDSTNARAVVIGGNIAQSYPLFKNALLAELESRHADVYITTSILGELSAVLGAGSFCLQPGVL